MNKKLFTQIKNEWRSNLWLVTELLLVSVVLWYIVDYMYVQTSIYNEPRGFDISHCYLVQMGRLTDKSPDFIPNQTDEEKRQIAAYLEKNCIQVRPAQSELTFDLLLTLQTAEHCVKLRIAENHTNIVLIEKDGVVLQRQDAAPSQPANLTDRSCLSVERILAFAEQVELEAVEPLIQRQLRMNLAIAEEGLRRDWGANIGSVLLRHNGVGVKNRAKAMAAAGSDARMSGCELPVCSVSGSGRPSAALVGLTCLNEAAQGSPVAARSSRTSCHELKASRKLIYPGRPQRICTGSSAPPSI